MQSNLDFLRIISPMPYNPVQQTNMTRSQASIGLLAILLPVVVVCAIMGYQQHQAWVLQQRIQRLNRIWRLNSSKNLP